MLLYVQGPPYPKMPYWPELAINPLPIRDNTTATYTEMGDKLWVNHKTVLWLEWKGLIISHFQNLGFFSKVLNLIFHMHVGSREVLAFQCQGAALVECVFFALNRLLM